MAAGAAAGAAIANASKASGVIVRVEPEEFSKVMNRARDPLIVVAEDGIFRRNYQYLMSYKGLTFFTKSRAPLPLPVGAELVNAGRIWIPWPPSDNSAIPRRAAAKWRISWAAQACTPLLAAIARRALPCKSPCNCR